MTAVDRTHRIVDVRFSDANPERITVTKSDSSWADPDYPWTVWRGDEALGDFPTHAEAIQWAHVRAAVPEVLSAHLAEVTS